MDWQLRMKLRTPALASRLMYQHNSDSRRAHAGWPDWTIGGPGGVKFRELKADGEDLRPEQAAWLAILRGAGHDADVWTPADFLPLEGGVSRVDRELFQAAGLRIAGRHPPRSPGNTPYDTPSPRGGCPGTPPRGIVGSQPVSRDTTEARNALETAKGPLAGTLLRSTTTYPVPVSLAADRDQHPPAEDSS